MNLVDCGCETDVDVDVAVALGNWAQAKQFALRRKFESALALTPASLGPNSTTETL